MMLFSKIFCFDFMDEALQVPVPLECGPDVQRIQQCFYRARQYCQARSDCRYDSLRLHVRGPTLVIKKRSVPTASQLGRKVEAHQELRECVAPHDIDVDCPGGSAQPGLPHLRAEKTIARVANLEGEKR